MSKPKSVVVIGGGGAGAPLARTLAQQPNAKVTLIEAREYYLHYPGALRMLVTSEGSLEDKVLIPYDRLFANTTGTVVNATVTSIVRKQNQAGGHVVVDSGDEIAYDVLVIASGSVWEGPLALPPSKAEAVQQVRQWRDDIKKAHGVAIVGGGPVGAEIAGEIRDIYPEKPVTIVQREDHLLVSRYPDKYRTDVEKRWKERKISLILNDEIEHIPSFPATAVTTKKGATVNADLVIPTRGGRPNTAFVSTLGTGLLTSSGHIKVEPTLQVQGVPGVFAVGDVLDWKEIKQVTKCPGHISVVVANVKSYLDGKPPTSKYTGTFELIVITNGAGGGAAYIEKLWGLCFGNGFAKMIKSKDLFITQTNKSLGY